VRSGLFFYFFPPMACEPQRPIARGANGAGGPAAGLGEGAAAAGAGAGTREGTALSTLPPVLAAADHLPPENPLGAGAGAAGGTTGLAAAAGGTTGLAAAGAGAFTTTSVVAARAAAWAAEAAAAAAWAAAAASAARACSRSARRRSAFSIFCSQNFKRFVSMMAACSTQRERCNERR
jgi:hypothetical protein